MAENDTALYQRREKKKRRRLIYTSNVSFQNYIRQMLHRISNEDTASISEPALKIVDTIVLDMFTELATEAANLMTAADKRTLSEWEVQSAVSRKLPGEVARHALNEGEKAKRSYIGVHAHAQLHWVEETDEED